MKTASSALLFVLLSVLLSTCSDDATTTPINTDPPAAYINASAVKGGILYDNFWSVEGGFNQSNANIATFSAKSDFFRCKQCHAWDLLGTAGSYNNRGAKTTRPNVSTINLYQVAKTKSAQQLFDAMKKTADRRDVAYDLAAYNPATNATIGDQMPNYTQYLTDAQIWDLVKFMKEGAYDVGQLYDATYTGTYPTGKSTFANVGKDGNAATGAAYYTANCTICHGADGKTFLVENMTIGAFTRSKANEVQHKVKHGQLGTPMLGKFDISLSQMKDLYKALADTVAFPK